MYNPNIYFIIGIGTHLVFWLAYKLLRKKWFMGLAIAISVLLVIIGFNIQGVDSLQMKGAYAANFLFIPILFLIIYSLSIYFFKLIFKNEPIMAGYMQLSWDQGEYRTLHMGDVLFTLITLMLPMVIPLLI